MRIVIPDLLPGTDYAIQVRADGGDGESAWSPRFEVTTVEDRTPPKVPTNVTWVVSGDSFYGEWDSIDANVNNEYALITRYELELVGSGVTKVVAVSQKTDSRIGYTLPFEDNRALFSNPAATVTMRVRAVDNKNLKGEYSAVNSATNPAPDPVNSITTNALYDAIDVKWDAGTLPDDFKSFMLQVSTTSSSSGFITVYEGPNSQFQHATTMFHTDHYYRVYVRDKFNTLSTAVTSGAGRPKSSFTVDTTAPDAPTSLTAAITNNANGVGARAALTWAQAVPAENDLAGFRVRWRQVGDTNWSQTDFSHEDRAGIIELQAAYKNYEFQIRSYDWMGNFSTWTATVTATSPNAGTPGQTVGVASVAGRDSIRYSWTPSTATNLKDYEVTFSTSSTFASGNITFKTGTSSHLEVGGLLPSTTYYARVRAINVAGTVGAWSATHTKATLSQLTPGDIGAPTTGDLDAVDNRVDNVEVKVDESIKSYVAEYAVNSSETVAPSSGWSTATPTRTPGTFIWTRTVVTYHDDTTSTTNPALLTGNTGAQGSQGIQGPPGSDGTSLFTWLKYADTPTTGMSDTPAGKTYIGIAYNKASSTESTNYADYSWSLIKGADGSDGTDGADGKGISNTVVNYAKATQGTNSGTVTGWGTSIPATVAGEFLWTRTETTYTDSSKTTAYSVAAHGATGNTGGTGPAGRGVSSTAVTYAKSTNGTTPPASGNFGASIPATTAGEFLWTRTITNYTDGLNPTTAYSVSAHGATGPQGNQGVPGPPGEDGQPTYTWIKYSENADGTGMVDEPTASTIYIGFAYNKPTQAESNIKTDYQWSLIRGPQGPAGADGEDGANAGIITLTATSQVLSKPATSNTTSPVSTTITATATNTTIAVWEFSVDGGNFGAAPAWVTGTGNSRVITGSTMTAKTITVRARNADSSVSDTMTIAKVTDGAKGDTGNTGAPGKGISSTAVTYQAGASPTTPPAGTWSGTVPATTAGQYLWTRTITSFTDGTDNSAAPAYSVSAHGATGSPGANGRSLTGTVVNYQVSSSGTVEPTGTWLTSIPTTSPGQFLWTRTRTSYSSAPTSVDSFSVAKHGESGPQGQPGTDGDDGADAYTVILTNEAATFAAGTTNAIAGQTAEVGIIAYKGATQIGATVSSVGTLPTGLTQVTTGSGGLSAKVVFTTAATLVAANGTIPINLTVDGKSFTKNFTFALSKTGATGPGGSTGVSVTSITPYYARITVGSTLPAQPTNQETPPSPWQETEPDYLFNTELYRVDRIKFSNNTYQYTARVKVSAYTAAVTAITAANGKSNIFFGDSAPTVSTPGRPGDVFWVRSGNTITEQWLNTNGTGTTSGNTWLKQTLSENTIGLLNAGKISTGTIDTAALTLGASGVIQSANYDTAASGFRLTATGMQIKGAPLTISNVSGLQADLNAKETPSGAQAKADAALTGAQAYVQGKGTDLIVNGYGLLGSNLNFTQFTFDPTDAPTGAAGSFVSANGLAGTYLNNEFLPVDPTKRLKFSYFIRQRGVATDARHYGLIAPYDAFKNQIAPHHYMFIPGTTTTLAAPLNPGDTTITLTSSANWHGTSGKNAGSSTHLRSIIWWDFVDQGGKAWPEHTYSRNHSGSNYWADGAIVGNVITLNSPYSGPAKPAGTKLSNGSSGGTYMYVSGAVNVTATGEWTKYGDSIIGLVAGDGAPSGMSASFSMGWPSGVAYARVGWLLNRTSAGTSHSGSQMSVAAVSLSDAAAAQDMASSAASSANAAYTRWAPSNATTIDGGKITTDSLDAIKIKAGSTFTQNLQVASTFTVGTASTNGVIQSYGYVANSAGWRLDKTTGLEINNGKVKASTLIGDTLGSTTGKIEIGAGASIIMNGGFLRSNTYGSDAYNAGATAGFFLSDGNLHIPDGNISAKALKAGVISGTNTIELSGANAKIKGGSWELSGSGLTIPDGAIEASKLLLKMGNNIMPARQASWEGNPATYGDGNGYFFESGGAIPGIQMFGGKFGPNKFGAVWGSQGSVVRVFLANSATDYNIPTEAGNTYIFSVYAYSSYALNSTLKIKWSNGTIVTLDSKTLNADDNPDTAIRMSGVATAPAGTTGAVMIWESTTINTPGGVSLDGAQVEEKVGSSNTPSPWTPWGLTTIEGSTIRTGTITSNSKARITFVTPLLDDNSNQIGFGNPETIDDPSGRPAFNINMDGDAEFSNMLIRGNVIVGVPDGGPTGDTTYAAPVTIGITSASKNITAAEGTLSQADVNLPISGTGIPSGATIESVDIDGSAAVLSVNATATNASLAATVTRPARFVSSMKSYNYVEGATGWILRSDGTAEFRDVAYDSLDGGAIRTDSLRAEAISAGSIEAALTISGSFETATYGYPIEVTMTSGEGLVTATGDGYFTEEDIGAAITGPGIPAGTTITYAGDPVMPQIAFLSSTVTATTTTTVTVSQGRKVSISSEGITLEGANGENVVVLPTDASQPAKFSGSIEATDLFVHDEFRMFGKGNSLGQAAELHLNSGTYTAPAPRVTFSYDSNQMTHGPEHKDYNPASDGYVIDPTGWCWDDVAKNYLFTYRFFGTQVHRTWGPGNSAFAPPGQVNWGISLEKAMHGGSADSPYGGMKVIGNDFYFLTKNEATKVWRLQRFPRSAMQKQNGPVASDRTLTKTWRSADYSSMNGNPAFDVYNGDVYIARLNNKNNIVVNRYNGTNIDAAPIFSHAQKVAQGSIASVNVGTFDMGGPVYVIVTTQNGTSATRQNYVFSMDSGGTGVSNTSVDFPLAGGYNTIGLAWIGSSNNDSNGHFRSLGMSGAIYQYTSFANVSGASRVYTSSKWRNISSNTYGPESTVVTTNIQRRAKVVVSSGTSIPNVGGTSPNAVAFYMGTVSTSRYRLPLGAAGVTSVLVDQIPTSGSYTEPSMAAGVPSKIVAGSNLEISGNGYIRTNRIVLQSTLGATANAGNTPALMVGNPVSSHLRIDGDKIISMNSDSSQGTLYLNNNGITYSSRMILTSGTDASTSGGNAPALRVGDINGYHLRIDGNEVIAMTSNTTQGSFRVNIGGEVAFGSGTVLAANGDAKVGGQLDVPNMTSGGSANVNYNSNNGRLRVVGSSRRFKDNIRDYIIDPEKVLNLQPRQYERNDFDEGDYCYEIGFIAEEAEDAGLEDFVVYSENGETFSFDYYKFSAVAHQAVLQKQRDQINTLQSENEGLRADLEAIKAHLGL